jgi:hypothetical protein
MTYTYGESRLAKARNEHDAAEARALEFETRTLELKAQKLAKELKELQQAQNRAASIYPTDPDWYQHRTDANAERAAHSRALRASRGTSRTVRARQDGVAA